MFLYRNVGKSNFQNSLVNAASLKCWKIDFSVRPFLKNLRIWKSWKNFLTVQELKLGGFFKILENLKRCLRALRAPDVYSPKLKRFAVSLRKIERSR